MNNFLGKAMTDPALTKTPVVSQNGNVMAPRKTVKTDMLTDIIEWSKEHWYVPVGIAAYFLFFRK